MFQVQNISKSYRGRPIFQDISFELRKGQCLGIAGQNGCGKSTLLGILAQTIQPDTGDILYQNRSVRNDRRFLRQKLGYVPQNCDLLPELTAKQQLELWLSACSSRNPVPEVVKSALGLEELWKVKISEMSGGMQKRVSIAMAMSTAPEILIMDEATAGLDAAYRTDLLSLLKAFLAQSGRIVWCSHITEEFTYLESDVLTLSSGSIQSVSKV